MVEFWEPDYNNGVPRTIVLKDYIDTWAGARLTWDPAGGNLSHRKRGYCTKEQ
jgi:hypothetical protein